jgi:hypothetical protein
VYGHVLRPACKIKSEHKYSKSFERVEECKYLRMTLTNQNSIHEEITSREKSEDASYHSVQYLLFSSLLSKNIRNKMYMPLVLYVCETWFLTLWEKYR